MLGYNKMLSGKRKNKICYVAYKHIKYVYKHIKYVYYVQSKKQSLRKCTTYKIRQYHFTELL